MENEMRNAIQQLIIKLGNEIKTEAELSSNFLNKIVLPYLRNRIGLIADAKLERTIKKGRYDARIGSLLFEFEPPLKGISKGIAQAKQYINEYRTKGEIVRCFVTDGNYAALVDEQGNSGESKELPQIIHDLQGQLSVLALVPVEPEDLLKVLGPTSDMCKLYLRELLEIFKNSRKIPFVLECYSLWKGVYGVAANLSPDVVIAVKDYAHGLSLDLKSRNHVEEFLFATETYLSIVMKLLIAAIAVKRRLVKAPDMVELLTPPLDSFENLAERVPFLKGAFEHDAFSWFIDGARQDKAYEHEISEMIRSLAISLEKIDLSKVRIDLLRRVYQEFFDPQTRKALGEFYTAEDIVNEVLDATGYNGHLIIEKTLLDPACGSGTFLIMAIKRFIAEAKKKNLGNVEIIEKLTKQLVGIDIHPFAVAMARVNYLLAISELIDQNVRQVLGELPIPIYWTDSLASFSRRPEPSEGNIIVEVNIAPLGKFILPEPKVISWDFLFNKTKKAIENRWDEKRFLEEFPIDNRLQYKRTLVHLLSDFEKRVEEGRDSRWLSTLRNVIIVDALAGHCDFVVGNPPWVRIHNISRDIRDRLKEFKFYKKTGNGPLVGWNPKFRKSRVPFAGLADYSIAFVEVGMQYLKNGGFLGFLITSKVQQALYANLMRRSLMTNKLLRLIDYSLYPRQLFKDAVNYPLIIIFQKEEPDSEHKTQITVFNTKGNSRSWPIPQKMLLLDASDIESPWMIAPPEVIKIFRKMQTCPRLGDLLKITMGIMTQADSRYLIKEIRPTDEPNILLVTTIDGQSHRIERSLVKPLVRGRDIKEWSFRAREWIIWTHDEAGHVLTKLPTEAQNYFGTIRDELKSRSDYKESSVFWTLFRVSSATLSKKTAWREVSPRMKSVYMVRKIKDKLLGESTCIPLKSVFFVPIESDLLGYTLSAFLNSKIISCFMMTFARKARGGYFYFASPVVGSVPIPEHLVAPLLGQKVTRDNKENFAKLAKLSEEIHKVAIAKKVSNEKLIEVDKIVTDSFKLTEKEVFPIQDYFDFLYSGS